MSISLCTAVPEHFHRLTRVPCPRVDHGYEDSFNGEVRIDLPADLTDRPDQPLQSVQGKLGRLDGNQYAVRTGKGIDRNQAQRRGTVEKDVVIARTKSGYVFLQTDIYDCSWPIRQTFPILYGCEHRSASIVQTG